MNSRVSKLFLALGAALALGACASAPDLQSQSESTRLAQIHPGLTKDDVRSLAGGPGLVTGPSRSGETMWIYSFTDTWGYPSEFDVTFDNGGVVESTYSERVN
jgi:outer membrane protein assembly factor BamE (lipoprotein component of BamABCDE complex)